MDRLIASDVMSSNNLCYVYPITRVQSVERLLRTTAYSAFLVVTPVEPEHVPERPKNVQDTHTPQLYRHGRPREWSVSGEGTDHGTYVRCTSLKSEIFLFWSNNAIRLPALSSFPFFLLLCFTEPHCTKGQGISWSPEAKKLETSGGYCSFSEVSYTLPEEIPNKTSRARCTERREREKTDTKHEKFLMFHGTILRSQLIELIKNKVFFKESAGVSI